jgi:hypothetical protein
MNSYQRKHVLKQPNIHRRIGEVSSALGRAGKVTLSHKLQVHRSSTYVENLLQKDEYTEKRRDGETQ